MSEAQQPPTLIQVLGSYGEVTTEPLSRVQSFTAKAMSRNWATIPQVTHSDLLEVGDIEAARGRASAGRGGGVRLSLVPYLMKAVARVLARMPRFNAAFDGDASRIILRRYVNLGLAVDTPAELVVAVIRACDAKSVGEIAQEAGELAHKARAKGLSFSEMSGGGFTVSSLGDLGGTAFTPIVNGPEVAILGVSRLIEAPSRGAEDEVVWRRMLPVSLTYDHRVINGADAGRFMNALREELAVLAAAEP